MREWREIRAVFFLKRSEAEASKERVNKVDARNKTVPPKSKTPEGVSTRSAWELVKRVCLAAIMAAR